MLPRAPWSCAGCVMGIPRQMWQWGHSRGDPSGPQSPAGPSVPAGRTSYSLLSSAQEHPDPAWEQPVLEFLPAPSSRVTLALTQQKRKIRHSEELHFSPFYKPDSGLKWDKPPVTLWCCHSPRQRHQGSVWSILPLPGRTPGAETQAAPHRLDPRLDHLGSAFPSQGKAPGRSEHSGAAAATLGTLGNSLEDPRNPECHS